MTNSHSPSSPELLALLKDQNELLRQQNISRNAESFREEMRGRARREDAKLSVKLRFVRNPYEKWR